MTTYPMGSVHMFRKGMRTMTCTVVEGGWNASGDLWDDASLAAAGWKYFRPV